MILIPGELIAILTFPGVILHEFAHKLACSLVGVKVLHTCYFQLKNPCGYVIHEPSKTIFESFLITIAPIIVCYGCASIVILCIHDLTSGLVWWFGMWVAFSFAMHALSSNEDIANLWAFLRGNEVYFEYEEQYYVVSFTSPIIWRILLYPLGGVVILLNALKPLWVDAIISVLLIMVIIGW